VPTGSRTGATASYLPGPVYCDASALVKLYVPEPESAAVNLALAGRGDLLVSDLSVTEVASSLARRRREGRLGREAAARAYAKLLEHVGSGIFQCVELSPDIHRKAERLLLVADAVSLRAADALHLALAQVSDSNSMATYDHRLGQAARTAGLVVFPRSAVG